MVKAKVLTAHAYQDPLKSNNVLFAVSFDNNTYFSAIMLDGKRTDGYEPLFYNDNMAWARALEWTPILQEFLASYIGAEVETMPTFSFPS